MIDRVKVKKELEEQFLGIIPELEDIKRLDTKIECGKPVLKDLKIMINHAYGVHKVLLEWQLESVEDTMARAEILREILIKKYQKYN